MEPETPICPVISPRAHPRCMYRVLHVYTANAPSSYTEAASHATASGSHSSVGLVRLISPFPRFSSCLLLPLPLLFPIFPIHRGRKKNIKKSAARLPAYSDSPGATAGPIAAAEQNSASAQRRMENSTEISPLSRFLFLLTGGAARVSEDRHPCQTASLSNGPSPTTSSTCRRMGEMGGAHAQWQIQAHVTEHHA